MAVLYYESASKRFSTPHSVDNRGAPQHSWRVLLLPYLGERLLYDLYDKLDLTLPWNRPDNLWHTAEIPDCYECPDASHHSDLYNP